MSRADALVVGAGHNGLAAAVVLAKAGWKVTVLERSSAPGGAVRTEEVTLPGFRHDIYATNLNLFVGGGFFAEFKDDLFANGFGIAGATKPFASAFPGGEWVGVSTDREETVEGIRRLSEADAEAWQRLGAWFGEVAPALFAVLGSPMPSPATARALWGQRKIVRRHWPELARLVLLASRELAEENFERPEMQALLASWSMHMDFSPDLPGGGIYSLLETFASAEHGMALGAGGAGSMIDALVSVIEANGGEVRTSAEVERIDVRGGRAAGVTLAGGERLEAERAVIANVTPGALFGRLLDVTGMDADYGRLVSRFRYGPGTLMIHLAMDDLPAWTAGEGLREHCYVHIGPWMGDMSLCYAQAMAGLLPERPTLVVGQPTAVDPSRAPDGKHVLWIQVRVVPGRIAGDAAGHIEATDWDEAGEPFADRVLDILEEYAPGLRERVLARHVITPADLERENPNLVGGDHLGGSLHPAQNFLFRPAPGWSRYGTPVERLYMCGSATWPGPGVGAGSGYLLGKELVNPPTRRLPLAGRRR